ncbi:PAAR domain-containing protein [Kosakonia sacchari]|uniref:PAAR domain-containing protein n=1 Tax=Kosakonia sacchari TaxID=1158459 RepID=UPI0025AF4FFC|nr:PAAR domain-containing protein [Kosakonia sacchari]MDN2485365.1 PAAR domain-containing protein [Kosakonia sacchari]
MAAKGYYLFRGDRTVCGGVIIEGWSDHQHFDKDMACEGHKVTCGKHEGRYRICGGLDDDIHGKRIAGTLHSYSSCPCKSKFVPSIFDSDYEFGGEETVTHTDLSHLTEMPVLPGPIPERQESIFADICKPEDNPLLNGVYIWTETTETGHAFVSVHENNVVYLYTYGRYGRTGGPIETTGDGILDFMKGDDAREYYRKELYENNARVFNINDASIPKTRAFFENLWEKGTKPVGIKENSVTDRTGHSIDSYDVTGRNCTTHTVAGIKAAGSTIFDTSYNSKSTLLPIEAEEYFAIPVSLQNHLLGKSRNLKSMAVVEVTDEFKNQYPNINGQYVSPEGIKGKAKRYAAETMSSIGSISPYSGANVGGILGEYDE